MSACGRIVTCFGRFGILYKCPVFVGSASVDTTPVTGHFTCDCRFADILAVGLNLCVSWNSTDCLLLGVFRALRIVLRLGSATGMATVMSRRLMPGRGSPLMWRFRGTFRRRNSIYNWILKVFTTYT